jgi:hypothetical protein
VDARALPVAHNDMACLMDGQKLPLGFLGDGGRAPSRYNAVERTQDHCSKLQGMAAAVKPLISQQHIISRAAASVAEPSSAPPG